MPRPHAKPAQTDDAMQAARVTMANNHNDIEQRLWDAADELRANSKLKSSEYSIPVLGLIFLRYADHKFTQAEKALKGSTTGRRRVGKADYQARGVLYLPEAARFGTLLKLTEGENLGRAINDAMKAVEEENEDLKGVLPRTYPRLDNATLVELLKVMASMPMDIEGDAFGRIYEYFLGNFAMTEGQKGGERRDQVDAATAHGEVYVLDDRRHHYRDSCDSTDPSSGPHPGVV